jgi:NAD+ synthase (glutamine-hydrolysing)
MRVLVAQLNPVIGAIQKNVEKIIASLKSARKKKADIVLFSELTICGYPPEDLLLHQEFLEAVEAGLQTIIPQTNGLMVVVGTIRKSDHIQEKSLFNSAAIIQDKKLVGFYDKCLLPTYDVFDERRYFLKGAGSQIWEWKGKKIGVLICEDMWQHSGYMKNINYSVDPVIDLESSNPDLILNLSASPYQFQKPDTRVKVCERAAQTLKCPVILCAQVGANDQLIFDGYSVYVNEEGKLCQLAKGFEEDEILVDTEAASCPCPFDYDPMQDLYRALVLGTRDYFHKQGFSKGLVGISGGIDSALVACIAAEALGKGNVYGVYMPSPFSSPASLEDARALAKNLEIKFDEISIEQPFQIYLNLLKPYFQGKASDVTEENLQARIRGTLLMALSNKLGHILLSTGNKSEMAMGYCTLYGDMAGGLAVISDVLKTQVYTLSKWINRKKEIIPLSTIEKAPSAELRPNQKDSDTLPEYATIDAVVEAYIEDFLSPKEIMKKHKLDKALVMDLIKRIHRAEYKRRQAPPGIRVSRQAFRVGRRSPIVQGWI